MLNTLFYDTGISWKIKDHVVALTAIPSSKKNTSTGPNMLFPLYYIRDNLS